MCSAQAQLTSELETAEKIARVARDSERGGGGSPGEPSRGFEDKLTAALATQAESFEEQRRALLQEAPRATERTR